MASIDEYQQKELANISQNFGASMGKFLDVELDYIKYLRNRERYWVGIKNIAATPLLLQQIMGGGNDPGGGIPPLLGWLPKRKRRKRVRVREYQPDTVTEKVTQTVPADVKVTVPNTQTVPGGVTVPDGGGVIVNPGQQLVPEVNVGTQVGEQLAEILEKQRNEDTNETRSRTLEEGGFVPEPALAWQLLDGTALVKRIEFEMQNGIGSAGLPETLYQRGSMHHTMALNAILAVEGLNIPEILSINNAMSAENLAALRAEFPEPVTVSGGWSLMDVVQLIGTIVLPFLDGPIPAGDMGAIISLANLMQKGRISWAMVRPIISIFGDDAVGWVMNQLKNLGVADDLFSLGGSKVSPVTAALARGGVLTSPMRGMNVLAGEAGTELVIPMGKVGDAIEAVYREGGSIMVGASLAFLGNLDSSSAKSSVWTDAKKLQAILGTNDFKIASTKLPSYVMTPIPIEEHSNSFSIVNSKSITSSSNVEKLIRTIPSDPVDQVAIPLIKFNEGLPGGAGPALTVYKDTKGNPTIGYGHLISSRSPADIKGLEVGDTITPQRAESLFVEDYIDHKKEAETIDGYSDAPPNIKVGLIDLVFNMGLPRLTSQFPRALINLKNKDYAGFISEIKYANPSEENPRLSLWYEQTGNRAVRMIQLMETSTLPSDMDKHNINLKPLEKKSTLDKIIDAAIGVGTKIKDFFIQQPIDQNSRSELIEVPYFIPVPIPDVRYVPIETAQNDDSPKKSGVVFDNFSKGVS